MGTDVQAELAVPAPRTCPEPDKRGLAVRAARRQARDWLDAQGLSGSVFAWDLELVVSELVTNAVSHAGELLGFDLAPSAGQLRITVADDNTCRVPVKRSLPPTPVEKSAVPDLPESDRGMVLVAALAQAWGVNIFPEAGYKEVWALFKL